MKLLNSLVLFRSDMSLKDKETTFDQINVSMFPFFETGVILHESFVIFMDDNGDTKILKNNYEKLLNLIK